jgi:hypothetical protein
MTKTHVAIALGSLLLLASASAQAQEKRKPLLPPAEPVRPHTMAMAEAGIMTLPDAPISAAQRGGDTPFGTIGRGDATVQVGMHLLYRANASWAVGAGVQFGPSPTADTEYGGLAALPRTHSRSYLTLGGEVRYIALRAGAVELWTGLTAGGVVIADRFITEVGADRPTFFGTREVTIRTEGFSFGLQVGGNYNVTERWVAGLAARTHRWILPSTPTCSPIGDCSTLNGGVVVYDLGLTLGYRIPL